MTATQSVKIFEVLNKHFKNADDARTAVEQIELIVEKKVDKHRENLTTKDDLHLMEQKMSGDATSLDKKLSTNILLVEKKLSSDIFQLEKRLSAEMHALELKLTAELQSTRSDIQQLELRVNDNISAAKVELMRWMLGIFITLMLAVMGLYFKS